MHKQCKKVKSQYYYQLFGDECSIIESRHYPTVVNYDNDIAGNGLGIANFFSRKFDSVYTNLDLSLTDVNYEFNQCWDFLIPRVIVIFNT